MASSALEKLNSQLNEQSETPFHPRRGGGSPVPQLVAEPSSTALAKLNMNLGTATPTDFDAIFLSQDLPESSGGANFGTRFTVSVLGDTFEEQQAAFKMLFPRGELMMVPATETVVFRESPGEEWQRFDTDFGAAFAGPGLFVRELRGEMADLGGDLPEIAGEIASMVAFRRPGAGQFVGDIVRGVLGGVSGETLQQIAQSAFGTQRDSSEVIRQRITGASLESFFGGVLGAGIGGTFNVLRGRGIGGLTEEGSSAVRAAERLSEATGVDVPELLPSQVSEMPIIQRLGRQSQALVPTINRYLTNLEKRTNEALRALGNIADSEVFISRTTQSFNEAVDGVLQVAAELVRGTSERFSGRKVQLGIQAWWQVSGDDVTNLYNVARAIEDPGFDASPLIQTAELIEQGIPARLNPELVGETATAVPQFRISELSGDLLAVIEDIKRLDPSLPPTTLPDGTVVDPVDQLRALRRRLDDLTLAGPEGPREAQGIAGQLRDAVVGVLESPTNGNQEFLDAWAAANGAASKRFRTREQLAVIGAVNNAEPSSMARAFAQPGQLDNLVALRSAMPDQEWNQFRDLFKTQLLEDPAGMLAKLDSFDQPTLNLLLTETERAVFRETAEQLDVLYKTGLPEAIEQQTRLRPFANQLFGTGNSRQIENLKTFVFSEGEDTPLVRSFQAAIVDQIWFRATVVERGIERIDFNRLTQVLDQLETNGALDILSAEQVSLLRDAQLIQDFARMGVDAGTSLQAAEAAAGARAFSLSALSTILENMTVGRFLTSEAGRRILTGRGLEAGDTRFFKLVGMVATNLSQDAEDMRENGEAFNRAVGALGRMMGISFQPET